MRKLTLARYILELSLMDYAFVDASDSKLAAAALRLALVMRGFDSWSPTLQYYTGFTVQDVRGLACKLNDILHKAPKGSLPTIRNKYSSKYPVSSFSYRLLDQMMGDPLFRIGDLNVSLYRKARQLERTRQLRLQLYYLKDFVLTCRFAEVLQEEVKKESIYLLTDLDVYSMQDLLQVKSSEMPTRFRELVSCSSLHVAECQLCMARGFVCELCVSKEVIFPWQLGDSLFKLWCLFSHSLLDSLTMPSLH